MKPICQNIDSIKTALFNASYPTGCIMGCYDFENISGNFFVRNKIYPITDQFTYINNILTINEKYNPAIFSPCLTNSLANFSNNQSLRIFGDLDQCKSMLIDFRINDHQMSLNENNFYNLLRIKSKANSSFPFSLNLSLSYNNLLYIDFSGLNNGTTELYSDNFNYEVNRANLISLDFNDSYLQVSNYSLGSNSLTNEFFSLKRDYFNQKKDIEFGKYNNSSDKSFEGSISGILLLDNIVNDKTKTLIFKNFLKTGEYQSFTSNVIENAFAQTTNAILNKNAIIGTGVTGYQLVPSSIAPINECMGANCQVFVNSGITGYIYGEKIEYVASQSNLTQDYLDIYNLYDLSGSLDFSKNRISFTKTIDAVDFFEVQVYSNFDSLEPLYYSNVAQKFKTNSREDGFESFINGVHTNDLSLNELTLTGEMGFSVDYADYSYFNKKFNNHSGLAKLNYNYSGSNISSGSWKLIIGSSALNKKYNVYLNGQKITNNTDYTINNGNLYIHQDLPTGTIAVNESNHIYNYTGFYNQISGLLDTIVGFKLIWTNGVLQIPSVDYYESISSKDFNDGNIKEAIFSDEIYLISENYRFNL